MLRSDDCLTSDTAGDTRVCTPCFAPAARSETAESITGTTLRPIASKWSAGAGWVSVSAWQSSSEVELRSTVGAQEDNRPNNLCMSAAVTEWPAIANTEEADV